MNRMFCCAKTICCLAVMIGSVCGFFAIQVSGAQINDSPSDSRNPRAAKALDEQARTESPSHKDVAVKIAELDAQTNAENQKNNLAALYDQAIKQASKGNLDSAITGFENVLQQSAGNYKDAKIRLETVRQQLAQKQQNEKLENDYAAGMAALRARNWTRAILAFENVTAVDRNYRDARKRLNEAQNGLERESNDAIVARNYADGVAAMNKNDLGGALAAFEKVRKINSSYRDVAALIAEVESALQKKDASNSKPETIMAAAYHINIDSLYQEAVAAAEREDWIQAVVDFEKIQLLRANYRDVVDHLAEARTQAAFVVKTARRAKSTGGNGLLFYIGSAVALIALPLLGVIMFSPATRARLHLLRGNYSTAVQIYEKILSSTPDKVKIYPALANLYLQQGRHDESAMKIYRTVLQLNLGVANRDEINAIVAQKYLTEGRTDSDAIEVLENELRAESIKQKMY